MVENFPLCFPPPKIVPQSDFSAGSGFVNSIEHELALKMLGQFYYNCHL